MSYEKTCWHCHKETMRPAPELGPHWFRCSSCDTTYVKPLEIGVAALSVERVGKNRETKGKPRFSRRGNRKAVR